MFTKDLATLQAKNLLRTRSIADSDLQFVDFYSNDYLGLSNNLSVIESMCATAKKFGVGSKGSQFICGYTNLHAKLENEFCKFIGYQKAAVFNCGYMANLGVLQAVIKKTDIIIADKYVHASIIDGCLATGANFARFRHMDIAHLKELLEKYKNQNIWVLTEGVFSMTGEISDIPKIIQLLKNHKTANLIIDDAHGVGVLGKNGGGVMKHFAINPKDVGLLIYPLGKAFGTQGAIVTGQNKFMEKVLQFARTLIYSTSLPPALIAASLQSLQIMQNDKNIFNALAKNIESFKDAANKYNLPCHPTTTAIQTIKVNNNTQALNIQKKLREQNILISAIRPPTVPSPIIRISLHSYNTDNEIHNLCKKLANLLATENISCP
ncbi:MAG: 8-amino-7-oxononanoate synthase [Thiotrichales bacterium]|nr:MAG: 8-amino-7-oxononanoate synthase [Thiotrichales bacterium]